MTTLPRYLAKMRQEGGRCNAVVWKRDTYRRTGRGPTGFEMHYTQCQCKRPARNGDLCAQHARMTNVSRWATLPSGGE